jgi:small subunit ribosomal protein S17
MVGTVVSDLSRKTLVVQVELRVPHPIYRRLSTKRKKFHVYDEGEIGRLGDTLEICEGRPRCALKRWELVRIVRDGELKRLSEDKSEAY